MASSPMTTAARVAAAPSPTSTSGASSASASQSSSSLSLCSYTERYQILQRHFPFEVVNAYLSPWNGGTILIPHDELLEALMKCPKLVKEEKPLEDYIEFLGGSRTCKDPAVIHRAATILALYWKLRTTVFEERAFYPIRMTTPHCPGVLSEQDMDVLNTGFLMLPPLQADPKGRSIYVLDASKLSFRHLLPHYEKSFLRIAFYMGQKVGLNPVSKIHGMVWVTVVTGKINRVFNPDTMKSLFQVSFSRHMESHTLFLPSKMNTVQQIFQSIYAFLMNLMNSLARLGRIKYVNSNMHFGTSDESVLTKFLQASKLNPKYLPQWIGGQLDLSYFKKWKRQELTKETSIYETEKDLKRREKVAQRSQTKRDRERTKIESLQQQASLLKSKNQSIQTENETLERLLRYAQTEVHIIEGLEDQDNKNRGSSTNNSKSEGEEEEDMSMESLSISSSEITKGSLTAEKVFGKTLSSSSEDEAIIDSVSVASTMKIEDFFSDDDNAHDFSSTGIFMSDAKESKPTSTTMLLQDHDLITFPPANTGFLQQQQRDNNNNNNNNNHHHPLKQD